MLLKKNFFLRYFPVICITPLCTPQLLNAYFEPLLQKTLLLAMESVFDKMRKVEIQEKAAEQAKEEASRSCSDILTEVENLKQMVNQARETYDMVVYSCSYFFL